MDDTLTIAVTPQPDHMLIEMDGELDAATAPHVIVTVEPHLTAGASVLIDAECVTFVDSAGLRSLLTLRARASDNDATLRIVNASEAARRLIELVGLTDHLLG